MNRVRRSAGVLNRATLALVGLAVLLDAVGRMLRQPPLWTLGAHAAEAGLALGLAGWLAAWFVRPRSGQVLHACGLAALGLARFLRGSAGVAPDSPLIGLLIVGLGLLALASWRRRLTLRARFQPDAPQQA